MQVLFIPVKSEVDILGVLKKVKIRGRIGLVSCVQFLDQLKKAKKFFKNSVICGQILGCNIKNAEKMKDEIDCFLYIGNKFHALGLIKLKKPIYVANPLTNEFFKITKKEIQNIEKRKKGKVLKFLNAEKIGILVSVKKGQFRLKEALELSKRLGKQNYIFVFDTLRLEELENFKEVDVWVNTACPRIEGENIINIDDLP